MKLDGLMRDLKATENREPSRHPPARLHKGAPSQYEYHQLTKEDRKLVKVWDAGDILKNNADVGDGKIALYQCIVKCCRGDGRQTAKGFRWERVLKKR